MKIKKYKTLYKWFFEDDIYHRPIVLFVGEGEEFYDFLLKKSFCGDLKVEKEYLENKIKPVITANGMHFMSNNYHIIWSKEFNLSTFLHELIHSIIETSSIIRMKINLETTEAWAYYTEYFFKRLYFVFKKITILNEKCKSKILRKN